MVSSLRRRLAASMFLRLIDILKDPEAEAEIRLPAYLAARSLPVVVGWR